MDDSGNMVTDVSYLLGYSSHMGTKSGAVAYYSCRRDQYVVLVQATWYIVCGSLIV